jgi:hypothetical protein
MPGPGGRAFGTIVSVGVDRLEIKKADGSKQTVLVDAQTNFREGRQQEIQLEDLKPGDRIMALGRTNENKDFVARVMRRVTDEEMARMPRPGEVAFGEIVAIDKDQLKVRNPMQGERVVVVPAPVVDEIECDLACVGVDLVHREDAGRVHDGRVETRFPALVQEDAVEYVTGRGLQPEADRWLAVQPERPRRGARP